jgi:SOS-response transcriptional repressor LexA
MIDIMREVFGRGADFRFRARGLSMSPFIKDGDLILVSPVSKVKPSLGMVVAFVQPVSGILIVHRVVGRKGTAFLIQGDNTGGKPDGLFQPQDILGCVTGVERNGRRVVLGLGPERFLIATLSRSGLLRGLFWLLRSVKGIGRKKPAIGR